VQPADRRLERHWLLYIAAIFHDIAKAVRRPLSAGQGRRPAFLSRARPLDRDAELVVFLVEHHLNMSSVAQKQDLSDPEVVRRFADIVQTERRLVALYLLTVADIRGTSPKVWNAWKSKLLEDLFQATQHVLKGGSWRPTSTSRASRRGKRLLRLYELSDTIQDALWKNFDVPYFLRHDAQRSPGTTRMLHSRTSAEQPVVKTRLSPAGEGLRP